MSKELPIEELLERIREFKAQRKPTRIEMTHEDKKWMLKSYPVELTPRPEEIKSIWGIPVIEVDDGLLPVGTGRLVYSTGDWQFFFVREEPNLIRGDAK